MIKPRGVSRLYACKAEFPDSEWVIWQEAESGTAAWAQHYLVYLMANKWGLFGFFSSVFEIH